MTSHVRWLRGEPWWHNRRILLAVSPDVSWSFVPGAIAVVAVLTALYVRRWREVEASVGRLASFLAGMALVLVALVSPVDRLAEQLFFMHMTQHLLLLDLAPILVLLGLTKVILRPATRRLVRVERAVGPLAHPVFAIGLYVVVMWIWHVPAMYDAALEHPAVHVLEHLTFAIAGGLYWWHLLSPIRSRRRLGGMGPVLYMVSTKLLVGLLGVGLAFVPRNRPSDRRPHHGDRAVDRHGHRARVPLRARARGVRPPERARGALRRPARCR
jgi:putative membrane protein